MPTTKEDLAEAVQTYTDLSGQGGSTKRYLRLLRAYGEENGLTQDETVDVAIEAWKESKTVIDGAALVEELDEEPQESVELVNVTSRDPDLSELLELLEDEGIKNPTNVYWTQPYRFEDAFQVAIVWYTPA